MKPDGAADTGGGPGKPDSLPSKFSALLRDLAHVPDAAAESAWAGALTPGAIIGRFELVREVGRGGFAIVWEARDRDLGRTVAFKALRPGRRRDAREDQLLREAELVARLSHPNIVTLFDVGRSEEGSFLVMEFLRGETLADRLERGPLAPADAARVLLEVAKGIAHAHAHGVVHRDLTPRNVFLCDDGQVKVLDLGMAHALGRSRVEGGTPGYMAPEQRRGAPEDERSDVFSMGVMLFRAIAGSLPFADGAHAAPALEATGAPGLPELVARMLREDPAERPRSAEDVRRELAELVRALERGGPGAGGTRRLSRRRRTIAAALTFAAGIAVAAAWSGRALVRSGGRVDPRAVAASIAVLPFADLSPDKDKEFFSDGLAEEILNALARVDGLRVPGRTSSFFFKGRRAKLEEIGRELNVRAVLEGSVRVVGNRVRVTADVREVADGRRLWGETYDRELTDIFAVQEEIAGSVAEALNVKLLGGAPSLRGAATPNPEVYTQYLVGRQQYHRLTPEGFARAVEAYDRALAIDPEYAPAWAGLGLPLWFLADAAATPEEAAARRQRAIETADRAVALAPDLPEALSTRGMIRSFVGKDPAGARADLERAIAVRPGDADAHRRYAILLSGAGELPKAIEESRKAVDLDPLGQSWVTLGRLYQTAGDLAAAEAAFRRHLRIAPDTLPGVVGLGSTLLLERKATEALALFERCSDERFRLWAKAIGEHALGHGGPSRAALDALATSHARSSAVLIAQAHAQRGEKEDALRWLDRATAGGAASRAALQADPFLVSLHGDPRFEALLLKLPPPPGR